MHIIQNEPSRNASEKLDGTGVPQGDSLVTLTFFKFYETHA